MLRGDRGITYAPTLPAGSRLVAGEWWPRRLCRAAAGFARKRDRRRSRASRSATPSPSTCSAATSRRASPTCARVDWQSLGINFVLVFSPGAFAGAPHTDIATLTFADGGTPAQETALVKALADDVSRGVRGAGQGSARRRRTVSSATWCSACAAPARVDFDRRRLGARRRARGRPAFPHLRRGHAEDAGRDPAAADRRLRDRIPADRPGGGAVRRGGRLACRRACRSPGSWNFRFVFDAGTGGRRRRRPRSWSRSCSGLSAPLRRSTANPPRFCAICSSPGQTAAVSSQRVTK